MTRIRYEDAKLWQEMELSGHAGDRIVCAGISAVSQTLLANLLREKKENQIWLQWQMDEPGEIWMRAWTTKENRESIRAMFGFVMTGFKQMAEDYPGNMEMKEERKNGGI